MRRLLFSTALAVFALPAFAQDAALLLGVERYRTLDRYVGGTDVAGAARELADAGYTVDAASNQPANAMRQMLSRFQLRSTDAERLIVAMTGRFATDGERSWLLSVDATNPSLFTVEQEGVSVESVLRVLAEVPGQSILLLGFDKSERDDFDRYLREGLGDIVIPQGVTVIKGDPRHITDLIEGTIVAPNAEIVGAVVANRNISLHGFRPKSLVMQSAALTTESPLPRPYIVDGVADSLAWQLATRTDTIDAYRAYLESNPRGAHVEEANQAIQSIRSDPNRAARLIEEGLSLSRTQRRNIQQDLSILNYNTRGIDGIFGAGTRAAISNWQQENGFSQTGFLTDEQVTRINGQAARRSAQLEAEAAREREAQLRRDRAYWDETGSNGGEPGLRSYLERFPDGIYADQAATQLTQIEERKLAQAARVDRDAWTNARAADSIESYQTYLKTQGRGAFRDEAEARLADLRRDQAAAPLGRQAQAIEDTLNLNVVTRRIIEARLAQLGLNVGSTDGQFDDRSRRAIREFQRSRNLEPTGYLTQPALLQLLISAGN